MKTSTIAATIASFLLIAGSGMANAAVISTFLTKTNNNNWSQPQNFAEVTVADNGSNVDFTVNLCGNDGSPCSGGETSNAGGQNIEQFGFNIATGFSLTAANFSGLPAGWTVDPNPGAMDGFGTFDITVELGGSQGVDPLMFSIIDVVGDSAMTYTSVGSSGGQPNAGGLFAAKVSSTGPGAFIGNPDFTVPAPGSLALLGLGLIGFGLARRRARS